MNWWTVQQLKSKDPELRRQAVDKLSCDNSASAIKGLMSAVADADREVRLTALRALARHKVPQAAALFVNSLRDSNGDLREAAVVGLAQVGDARYIEVLIGVLKDPHLGARRRAAHALDAFGWKPETEGQCVQRAIALGNFMQAASFGDAAVEPLIAVLKDHRFANRRGVVEALSHIEDDRVYKPLGWALKDADQHVRVAAVEALGNFGDARCREELILGLKDKNALVRGACAAALGKLPPSGSSA
jgi:HEAT repeat protein